MQTQQQKNLYINDETFYEAIPASVATFKSGADKPFHRWFRLTPSFGPDLVRLMLKELQHKQGEIVLDPYAGASTTLLECKLQGISSYGFEINPLLHFIGKVSIEMELDLKKLVADFQKILLNFRKTKAKFLNTDVEEIGIAIPPIHNPFRWWRKDVLKDLLVLKKSINDLDSTRSYKDFFLLGLAGVLVPDLTNVTLGKLQLHFINRDKDEINVIEAFSRHIEKMLFDLNFVEKEKTSSASTELFLTDSTNPRDIKMQSKVSCVITSPPYPNRYSYVWNTRPHLFFLDIFSTPKQSAALDLKSIGGTWGSATSILMKGEIEPKHEIIKKVVLPIVLEIRQKDNLMANYVMKYFNALADQIIAMDQFLTKDARVAYVIGCSEIKGVRVEADVLLGQIFKGLGLGYKETKVHQFRRRNSGQDLFESIVYAWKN